MTTSYYIRGSDYKFILLELYYTKYFVITPRLATGGVGK